MLREGGRVLVAVSGGKDSLALWEMLGRLGYEGVRVDEALIAADPMRSIESFATAGAGLRFS
jgi:tRNA(Ile)-lysidine synthase TilS/MesJ